MPASIASSAFSEFTVAAASHTVAHTLVAGTNRKVVVFVHCETSPSAATVSGITFDGAAMTLETSLVNPGDAQQKTYAYVYDVLDAASGAKNIVVTMSQSTAGVSVYVYQLNDAATGAATYAAATSATNSVSVVSNAAVSVAANDSVVLAVAASGSGTPTFTWSGGTVTERLESNETNYTTTIADAVGVASGTKTVTATASSTAGYKGLLVVVYESLPSTALTDIDTDETITTGQALVSYTGTGLTDADGLLVKSGTKSAAATSFVATNATSGTFTAPSLTAIVAAGVKFGTISFDIQDGGVSLATLAGTLNPETGWQVHNVTDISQAANVGTLYYGASPAVAVSDQFLLSATTATHSWPITVDAQGHFTIDSAGSTAEDTFSVYAWDATDETWSTVAIITFNYVVAADGTLKLVVRDVVQSAVQSGIQLITA